MIILTARELFSDTIGTAWHEAASRYATLADNLTSLDNLAIATQELELGMDREEVLELATGLPR